MVSKDFVHDALEGSHRADRLGGAFVGNHFPFGSILLVVEPEATVVVGRVIQRTSSGVDGGIGVFGEEVNVFDAKGLSARVFGASFGVFTWSEHEEVADDTHVLDAAPLVGSEGRGALHGVELGDDAAVDGPDSSWRRICSGVGREHGPEAFMVTAGGDGRGALGFVHHPDDFLADGTEVLSHCARSCLFVGGVEVAAADAEEEDLEESFGPLDPKEMAIDSEGLAVILPLLPARGLVASGGVNHRGGAGILSAAEISEERAFFGRWQSRQPVGLWGKERLK